MIRATDTAHMTSTNCPNIFFYFFCALITSRPFMCCCDMTFFDGSPFVLDIISDRFEVALRRYHLFMKEIPGKFQHWLSTAPSQKRVFSALDSICTEMFPDMMSIASPDFPHRWTLPVACVALKHYVSTLPMSHAIEISECGRALRVVDNDALPFKPTTVVSESKEVPLLRSSLLDSICAASRTAALEVKVAELECRPKGLLPLDKEPEPRKKRKFLAKDSPVENVFAYLSECRTEALDALVALRKTGKSAKRHTEKLAAANAEISRLRAEVETLLRQQQPPPTLANTQVLLPKRVLSLAGFWNLSPNDLLLVTPALIDTVQQRGGTVIQRDGMHVCFSAQEKPLLIEAALQAMADYLPQYKRRLEF